MGFVVHSHPELLEIRIEEESLDRSLAAAFREKAAEAIPGTSSRVAIDCSSVDFIDSSGVGALLHINNLLPEEQRPVILKGVRPSVLSVLELVRVHRFFEISN